MYILEIMLDSSVNNDVIQYYNQLENRETSDSGVDLIVTEDINTIAFGVNTLKFKIRCQMKNTKTNQYSPYYLYPRSSISKTPLVMANSVGIIDRDYRGEIMAKVRNIPLASSDNDNYLINEGTRLFQICSPDLSPIKVKIVDCLTETSRGEGGFGSTGQVYHNV